MRYLGAYYMFFISQMFHVERIAQTRFKACLKASKETVKAVRQRPVFAIIQTSKLPP